MIILVGVDLQTLIPQLGVFMIAAFKLLPAMSRMLNSITQIMRRISSIDTVYQVLHEQDEEFQLLLPEPEIINVSNDIVISSVTFKYPRVRKAVIRNASFVIPQNKSVGIIGYSGAGKSTLVDIILGVLSPQSGSITYNGKSIHHHFDNWAKHIGYVPQEIYLLDETLLENIAFGISKSEIDENRVWYALEQAQLKEFAQSLPEGLQTKFGERGVRLSGGQRQRIGIARALYDNPTILVLDEATSSLDNETEEAVMMAIKSLQGSKTMIIIAHRLTTIEHCDIVYRVRKGTVTQVR
jgi:ABC-type multidrug transport system fused ATPase/permease subunit